MSDDFQEEGDLKAKNAREAVLVLAREMRSFKHEMRTGVAEIKEHQEKQNGKVDKNCNRLTKLETIYSAAGVALTILVGIITRSAGTWPWN